MFTGLTFFWPNMGMRIVGFSWKIKKKCRESTGFLRKLTLFWQNMGMRAEIFSWKIGKKGASFWLFWPILECSSTEVTFLFDQIWAWQQRLLHETFEKNDIGKLCFWENGHFFTKYGHDSSEIFWRKDVFLTKYGHERIDYFVENQKKRASWFCWSII